MATMNEYIAGLWTKSMDDLENELNGVRTNLNLLEDIYKKRNSLGQFSSKQMQRKQKNAEAKKIKAQKQ